MKINSFRLRVSLARAMLLASAISFTARADYQSTVLSQGPVGYWRLNETNQPPANGTTANLGSLGAAANGTYNGSPTHRLPGPFAGSFAIGLNGSAQSVTTPYQAGLNNNAFSFEVWAKPAIIPFFNYVAASAHLGSPRSGWYLAQDTGGTFGDGSAYVVRMFNQNGTTPSITLFAPLATNAGWYDIVLTFDGTTATLYTNGVVAMSGTPAGYVANVDTELSIGCRSDNAFYWQGQAAEEAIYPSALSAARVAAHYTTATTTPANYASTVLADSPLLYHRYTEAPDVLAQNSSTLGSALNAKYQIGTTPGVAGPQPPVDPGFEATNTAVSFPGTGPGIVAPALNLFTNTVTITGWINPSTASENPAAGIVVCDAGTTYAGLTMDGVSGGLGLGYVWNNDPSSYNWSPTTDAGLPTAGLSNWTFVALIVAPNQASIFLCPTNDPTQFAGATNNLAHVNQAFNQSTLFGSDAGQATLSFAGGIDEVAIFNRSLGVGEVYSQYAAAVGGVAPKIFSDPQPPVATIYSGDTWTVAVDAGGTPNLTYRWYKGLALIPGATNASYSVTNTVISDSGNYSCNVSNLYGSVTSGAASIVVNPAFVPAIVSAPTGHTLYPGGTLSMSVSATGGGLKYQWKLGSTPISGATSSNYVVLSVKTTNSGSYSVVVSNSLGSVVGGPATVTVLAPANAYETNIVADAPEAWYRLNETGGTNMFDSMGRHDGVYTNESGNPVTFGAAGAIAGSSDTGVTFSKNDKSYGIVPFSSALNSNTFSIECWAKTSDTSDTLSPVSSHSKVPQGYGIWTVPSGSWSGEVSSGGNNYYVPSTTANDGIVATKYTHIVMVFDTALKVYVNGQWDGGSYVQFERNAGAPFIIGALGGNGTSVSDQFDGQVDEVLVYTYALTLAQAQKHYSSAVFPNPIPPFFTVLPASQQVLSNASASVVFNGQADGPVPITYQWYKNGSAIAGQTNTSLTLACTYSNAAAYYLKATNPNGSTNSPVASLSVLPGTPAYVNVTNGLVLHLKFDGNANDSSGRGNNATLTNITGSNPTFSAGVIGSGALHYGTDTTTGVPIAQDPSGTVTDSSYATLGTPSDLAFSSNVNFSVSYWVKLPVGYVNGDLPFLCSAVQSFGNPGFVFAPGYTNGAWSFSLNGVCQFTGNPSSINDGNWHHLVHTVDRTGYAYSYLDGAQVDSRLATGIGNLDTGNVINIGQDPTGLYPEQGSADIDDLAVWRRALNPYEAYAIHYAATNSGTSFDVPGKVSLSLTHTGTNVTINWVPGPTLGTLQQATNLSGPWIPVTNAFIPSYTIAPTNSNIFFRLSFTE